MAYQNVGTPRFYVNSIEWLTSNGILPDVIMNDPYGGGVSYTTSPTDSLFKTIPTQYLGAYNDGYDFRNLPIGVLTGKCFVAILGHTFNRDSRHFTLKEGGGSGTTLAGTYQDIANADVSGDIMPAYDGFSIVAFEYTNNSHSLWVDISSGTEAHSIILGNYYDMPHSPDLNLTMTREYGGIKTIETKGGASLSNDFGSSPPAWGNLGAWELSIDSDSYERSKALTKRGRRVWNLSFSYLQDSDVFGPNQMLGALYGNPPTLGNFWYPGGSTDYTTDGYEADDIVSSGFAENVLTDDSFYSQVIHKTNGGQLPFIFQPDSSNTNPDQFAIAKLDMKSFKFDQVANSVYNVKLKIREVW